MRVSDEMEKDEKNAMKGLPLKTMAFLLLLVVTFFTSSCRQKEVYTMLYYDLKRLGSFLADNEAIDLNSKPFTQDSLRMCLEDREFVEQSSAAGTLSSLKRLRDWKVRFHTVDDPSKWKHKPPDAVLIKVDWSPNPRIKAVTYDGRIVSTP